MSKKSKIMVCVTQQKTCERLIQSGVKIKEERQGELFVVHVSPMGWDILGNSKEGEAMDYLFQISKSAGANMAILKSSDVIKTIMEFCQNKNINIIVLGESLEASDDNNIIAKLNKKLNKKIELKIVPTY